MKIDEIVEKYLTEAMGKKVQKLISTMRDDWDEMLGADARQWTEHLKTKYKANDKDIEKALKYFKIY